MWGSDPETGRRRLQASASGLRERRVVPVETAMWVGVHTGLGTHVGLGPVDEDLSHHPEQLLSIGIGLCQPVCPGGQEGMDRVTGILREGTHPESSERLMGTETNPIDGRECFKGI